jgi:hypothetical protein
MFVTAVAVSDAVCQSPRLLTDAGGAAAAYGKVRGIETFDTGFSRWYSRFLGGCNALDRHDWLKCG